MAFNGFGAIVLFQKSSVALTLFSDVVATFLHWISSTCAHVEIAPPPPAPHFLGMKRVTFERLALLPSFLISFYRKFLVFFK